MNESEIIQHILQGDKDKYRLLVEKYQQTVFTTCMGFVHNREDADDLTQEVFISAYQSLKDFRGNAAFSTWLYRIAVNASLNRLRKSSKNILLQRLDELMGKGKSREETFFTGETDDPENMMIHQEQREWVQKALDSLPVNQRTAIVLSKYDDLPQREISQIMGVSEGAVEALIQRAKKNLREKLSSHDKKIKK